MGRRTVVRWMVVSALVVGGCTGGGSDRADSDAVESPPGGLGVDDEIHRVTLDNGLQVYVRENRVPGGNAEMRLAVRAGSVNETADQVGVAHFVEHMMFNGTASFPANDLIDELRGFGMEFGADVNAYTTYDETVYQLSVPTSDGDHLGTGLDILAEWLSAATLDPEQVAAEAGVVLDEWRQSEESYDGRLSNVVEAEYLTGSAYEGHDPIGTEPAITAMTTERLRAFYDTWYRPDNAAVIVVGDVDADELVEQITERFGDLEPRSGPAAPTAPDTTLRSFASPSVSRLADPDTAVAEVEVTLPAVWAGVDDVESLRAAVLTDLAFQLVVTRFTDDLARGDAVFTDAYRSNNGLVRPLDAPSLVLTSDPADFEASLDALLVELERADRYGFDDAEVERIVRSLRRDAEDAYDGSDSTQDAAFAEQYVEHFLGGAPIMDARTERDTVVGIYDSITPDEVSAAFSDRYEAAGAHLLVLVPDTLAAAVPGDDELLARMAATADAVIEPRDPSTSVSDAGGDELMAAVPEPVEESSSTELTADVSSFLEPIQLTFPNGARVVLNRTEISTDQVSMSAVSPGGLSLVDEADVPEARVAAEVVAASGIGEQGPVELETILSATSVQFQAYLDQAEEGMFANSTTSDVETLLQLVNLTFTDPRFDQVALDSVVDSWQPYVDDPLADPDLAYYAAFVDARYGDASRWRAVPTADELAGLDLATVEKVWRERFSNVGDWVFSLSGDFDVDDVTELARRYLGSIEGGGEPESFVDLQPSPPDGVVTREVHAGSGDKATLSLLYDVETELADDRREDVLGHLLSTVLTNRLTDHVREELGASYSPYGSVTVTAEPDELVETVIQVTGDPDAIADIATVVQDDLTALRTDRPTVDEFEDAVAAATQEFDLFDNDTIADLLARTPRQPHLLDAFISRRDVLADVTRSSFEEFIVRVLPADRYIDLRLLPA